MRTAQENSNERAKRLKIDLKGAMVLKITALTDIGKHRKRNEDNVRVGKTDSLIYAVVADGMGGHKAGEVASLIAAQMIEEEILKINTQEDNIINKIKGAYIDANSKIYEYAEENQKVLGMGTTAVSAIIVKGKLYVANVGDSRAYMINPKGISQISKDHSYVQQLIDSEVITKEQAMNHPKRNYITRAMGTEEGIKVDVFVKDYNGETVLLCSDGLCGLVTDNEILDIVKRNEDFDVIAKELTKAANSKGGTDNITVALLKS